MATSKRGMRSTRKLRDWTVEQVESGKFPGLVWDDPPAKTMFRIPWKHAGKQEFRQEEDAGFFKNLPGALRSYVGLQFPSAPASVTLRAIPGWSRNMSWGAGNKVKRQNTKQVKMDDSSSPEAASPREEIQPLANSPLLLEK
ncbi:Interferon regulatory factor 9, partial [Ophiophagus hannah]